MNNVFSALVAAGRLKEGLSKGKKILIAMLVFFVPIMIFLLGSAKLCWATSKPIVPVKTVKVQSLKKTVPPTIQGLTSIRVSGGIWDNWDADAEKDGPTIDIVYLDKRGEIITSSMTKRLQIGASVKIWTKEWDDDYDTVKGRLVFSKYYQPKEIIFGSIYPEIRIPKELIKMDEDDYDYGIVEVTIRTPGQGRFADISDFIVLKEDEIN